MKTHNHTRSETEAAAMDLHFVLDGRTIRTSGHIKSLSDEIIIITFDVDDNILTLPVGTDVYLSKEDTCYNVTESKNFPEVKAVKVTRRKYVRVDDVLKVDYQKVVPKAYQQHQNKPEVILNDIFGAPFKVPGIDEVDLKLLYKLIYQTNLKMDRILDLLENRDKDRYESVGREGVNISGSGMKFIATRTFSIDDVLAMRTFLPLPSKTQLNLLGKVTSVRETGPENRFEVCVRFVDLTEKDRKAIVKYVFQRQRELIRLSSHDENQKQIEY
jgi:hypothetical protein